VSIVDAVRANAELDARAPAVRFLPPGHRAGAAGVVLDRGELDRRARAVAGELQKADIRGERVLVALPPGPDFVVAFLGCLFAGAVAVPCAPPRVNARRFAAVGRDSAPAAILLDADEEPVMRELWEREGCAPARWIPVAEIPGDMAAGWTPVTPGPAEPAVIQYTSGSTGDPKGVLVSTGAFAAQLRTFAVLAGFERGGSVVSWMPVYHALGLGHLLLAQLAGGTAVFMTPEDFVAEPYRWLRAISDSAGPVLGGGPNFAYDLCVDKTSADQRAELDLTGWQVALLGGERIRADTLDRFAAAFAPSGFRRDCLLPAYGLTEVMQIIAAAKHPAGFAVTVDAEELADGRAREVPADGRRVRELVRVGVPGPGSRFLIVDPATAAEVPAGTVGELWLTGPGVCDGYWGRPGLTNETFGARLADGTGPFLRTGDLAFLHDGQLVLCGRSKELIILHGKNYQPQDIEVSAQEAVAALAGRPGAAFSVEGERGELLVLVQSVGEDVGGDLDALADRVRRGIVAAQEVDVHEVLLVAPDAVPRTASGKIQRTACRQAYLDGALEPLGRSGVRQPPAADELKASRSTLLQMVESLPPTMRSVALEADLCRRVGALAGIDSAELTGETALSEAGLDSIRLMALRQGLQEDFGVALQLGQFARATVGSTVSALLGAMPPAGERRG
jgi:acyl-CoA synthetase (AMP-forming)/AMP-acid ligase II/aryl carrier-like protein